MQNYDSDIKEMHAVTGNHRGCLGAEHKGETVQEHEVSRMSRIILVEQKERHTQGF